MRHLVLFSLALCGPPLAVQRQVAASGFGLAEVERMAEDMASREQSPQQRVAEPFLRLDYDGYRKVAPRYDIALWQQEPFHTAVQFFAAGFIFEYPVEIFVVENGHPEQMPYDSKWFEFRDETAPLAQTPGNGFSGFRLLTRFAGEPHKSEYLVFQGASYFRGIGFGQNYGSSARALAVDVGLAKPEEFPRFRKFWIEKLAANDVDAPQRLWALVDSPGIVGAYEFSVQPGNETTIDVTARLRMRHNVEKLALAPLTSMWMWDDRTQPAGERRPEVHDADGLLIHGRDNTWIWRELTRPQQRTNEQWRVEALAGFGLMQRDRDESHYLDAEAHYSRRPNVWVDTKGEWPWNVGSVELLELPAEHEGMDNIGAYFVFDNKDVVPGKALQFAYRVTFGPKHPSGHNIASVVDSRFNSQKNSWTVSFRLPQDHAARELAAHAQSENGECTEVRHKVSAGGIVAVTFDYTPLEASADRLQVWLSRKDSTEKVSEVWSNRWLPALNKAS